MARFFFSKLIASVATATIIGMNAGAASAASITVENYQKEVNQDTRALNLLWLDGVKEGLVSSSVAAQVDGKQPLFCLPGKLALTAEQAEDLMLRWAKAHPEVASTNNTRLPASLALLGGLVDTFPCH